MKYNFSDSEIKDPVQLFGEGQYNLLSLKEIVVTDSFMGLDTNKRNCQNIETVDDCKTRLHVENFRHQCGCIPLTLKLSEKDSLCIENKDILCSQNITTPNLTSCISMSPCSGLVISGCSKKMFSNTLKAKSLKTELGKA